MDQVILDTDGFSYLARADDRRGHPYRRHTEGKAVTISFITVGEVLFGAARRDWGDRRVCVAIRNPISLQQPATL